MAKYNTLGALFTAIANSLRSKTGGSGKIVADDFPTVIDGLSTGGITPTGTKTITSNGTHDVTSFASAVVNVPQPPQIAETHIVNITSTLGNGTNVNPVILSGSDFVKNHYADNGFAAYLMPATQFAGETNVMHFIYHGNANNGSTNAARHGFFYYSTSASAVGTMVATAPISGKGYNVSLRADSAGNINLYVASKYIVKPGAYILVLVCTD